MLARTLFATDKFTTPRVLKCLQRTVSISMLRMNHPVATKNRFIYNSSGFCPLFRLKSSLAFEWNDDQLKETVCKDKIVVFMKGTPMEPQCGFSKHVIQIFHMHGCDNLTTLNVLDDENLRSRIKEYSSWPTIPQVFINGEFIGGFDILLQMHQSGELIEELENIGHRSALLDAETDQ